MEIPPAERLGERHVWKEYDSYRKAIEDFVLKKVVIKQDWIDELYEANRKIWDVEAGVRVLAHKIFEEGDENPEDVEVLKEIGMRFIKVGALMKERDKIKNKIFHETGEGFEEIKVNHSAAE